MKKKTAITALFAVAAGCMAASTACGGHEHAFSEAWSHDDTYHWHAATCGHDDAAEKALHAFGEWQIQTPATETAEGAKTRKCGTCGYVDFQSIPVAEHKHTFSEDWTYDSEYHWHTATCGHDEVKNRGKHAFAGGTCMVCNCTDPASLFTFTEVKEGEEVIGYSIVVKSSATSLEELTIPANYMGNPVVEIGELGLSGIAAKQVEIPSTVKTIGNNAFWGSALEEVTIPDSVETMGYAFYQNDTIKRVTIGSGLKTIAAYTFRDTPALECVEIGSGVKTIEKYAFYKSAVPTLVIPDNVESLADYFCYGAENLKTVTIGSGITKIPSSAFEECKSLRNVTFGQNVTEIGSCAFRYCDLEKIALEGKITTVGHFAFNYNANLYSVTLGENVTSTDSSFFEDYRLIEICNKSSVELVKGKGDAVNVQNLCSNENEKGTLATTNDGFSYYTFNDGGTQKTYLLGYNGEKTALTLPASSALGAESYIVNTGAFDGNTALESVVIPDGVTEIMQIAFFGCSELKSVSLGNDVATIGRRAFKNCGLTSVTIPESVTAVKLGAFAGCPLKRVEWNAVNCAGFTAEEVQSKTDGIFSESSLTSSRNDIETLVFGNRVQTIPARVFRTMLSVKSVTIPASVKKIDSGTFYKCGFTSVTFEATSGWIVADTLWGKDSNGDPVKKTPSFSNQSEILEWLNSATVVWTRS